jgi:hypothetical protein
MKQQKRRKKQKKNVTGSAQQTPLGVRYLVRTDQGGVAPPEESVCFVADLASAASLPQRRADPRRTRHDL